MLNMKGVSPRNKRKLAHCARTTQESRKQEKKQGSSHLLTLTMFLFFPLARASFHASSVPPISYLHKISKHTVVIWIKKRHGHKEYKLVKFSVHRPVAGVWKPTSDNFDVTPEYNGNRLIKHRFIEQTAYSSSFGWKKNDPIFFFL